MRKIVKVLLSAATALLYLTTCSNLDSTTSVGLQVVKEYDSTLTNFSDNFHTFRLDTTMVTKQSSIPGTPENNFGFHSYQLAAGAGNGFTVFGSVSFYAARAFADRFESDRVFDSITFYIDTVYDTADKRDDQAAPAGALGLYSSTYDNRFNHRVIDSTIGKTAALDAAADTAADSSYHYEGLLADTALRDSIFSLLRMYIANRDCHDGCQSDSCDSRCESEYKDTTSDSVFYFSLFSTAQDLRWFDSIPGMVIHSHKADSTAKDITDTIWGVSYYVTAESDSLIEALAQKPVSRFLSGRTALFKLDFSALWDTLEHSSYSELLAAALVLPTDTLISADGDSSAVAYYLFTNSLITDGRELSSSFDSAVYYSYSKSDTVTHLTDDTLTIAIGRHLQQHLEKRPSVFYLYLQVASSTIRTPQEMQEIYWKKPQLKAVLTTIR